MPRQVVRDFGTALSFDGVDDKVAITSVAAQNDLTTASLSCWIYIRGLGGNSAGRFFDKGTVYFQARVEGITLRLQTDWSTDGDWSVPIPSFNKWHHVVITYDGSSTANDPIIYIDGVVGSLTENVAPVGTRGSDSTSLTIGNRTADTARGFNGYIDEVQWYNKILSQAEVTALYYQGTTATGLVGQWKLDEGSGTSVTDSTGNASAGTISGGATYTSNVFMRPRQLVRDFGTCLNFDGIDDIASITTVSAQNDLTTITLAAWINPRSFGESSSGRIFSKASGLTGRWRLGMNNSGGTRLNFVAQWNGGSTGNWASPVGSIQLGVWQHVAVTYDMTSTSNDPLYYINGVLVSTTETSAPSGSLTADDANAYIGNDSTTARTFDGLIDDVQLYNKVLTQAEITALYYQGQTASGLVGQWKLDEGSGTTATDSTGNANGTITGATYSTDVFMDARSAAGNRQLVRDFGTCLNFISASSHNVSITQTSGLPIFSQSGYSVSVWFNRRNMSSANCAIYAEGNSGSNNQGFVLGTSNAVATFKPRVFVRNDANVAQLSSVLGNTVLENGKWYNFVWTDNNGVCALYVNGVLDTQNFNYTPTGSYTLNRSSIGALIRSVSVDYFEGKIDEVAVYNRVLSATEASDIYQKGIYPTTNNKGFWRLDEGSGSSATDSSGNNNTGTITGATYSSDVPMKPRTVVT